MSKKKQFDWKTHSKPARLLSAAQEQGLLQGDLSSVLRYALDDPSARLEIRPRAVNLYRDGASLMRLTGDGPFTAELDSVTGGPPERVQVADASDVAGLLAQLQEMHAGAVDSSQATSRRSQLHAVASANSGGDLWNDELVVVDTEYNLGQRKLDLVALRRTEGVTGPGAFANPELIFVDVRCCGQTMTGNAGPAAVGSDFAEFAKALGGEHLQRAKEEIVALVGQKIRLGLLPANLELRGFDEKLPELLVLFVAENVADARHTEPIAALHEKLTSRRFPAELLTFGHYAAAPEFGDHGAALREGDVMNYREFKAYRQSLR